jgi:hypothetical protein
LQAEETAKAVVTAAKEALETTSTAVNLAQEKWNVQEADPNRSDVDGFRTDVSETLRLSAATKTQIGGAANLYHLPNEPPQGFSFFGSKERVYTAVTMRTPDCRQTIQKQSEHSDAVDGKVVVRQFVAGPAISALNVQEKAETMESLLGR